MKNIFFILIINLFVGILSAQDFGNLSKDILEIRNTINLRGTKISNSKNKIKVEGNLYLYKSWNNSGKIYFSDKVYILKSFNYNIYSDRFEIKLTEDSVFIINPGNVKMILINDKIFKRYLDQEFQRNIYFEEIIDFKEFKLLKKLGVIIREGTLDPLTKVKIQPDRFLRKDSYYLKNNENDDLEKIKLNKSKIISLINDNQDVINNVKQFAKKNKLSYKKIDDVNKILEFYNSL